MKKAHQRPAIIHKEKIEARAATCSKSNDACANQGPGHRVRESPGGRLLARDKSDYAPRSLLSSARE